MMVGAVTEKVFEKVAASERPCLILDYDGTISPHVAERDRAKPYPGIVERLQKLCDKTRVVLLSGRSLKDLLPLVPSHLPIDFWGSYGLERFTVDEEYTIQEIGVLESDALEQAAACAAARLPESRFEVKPGSVAVHWRGVSDREREQILETILPPFEILAKEGHLDLCLFNGGIEIRSRVCDKRRALGKIVDEIAKEDFCAYLGDDETDVDAFEALVGRGLKVYVGDGPMPDEADLVLRPPQDVLNFFDQWLESTR